MGLTEQKTNNAKSKIAQKVFFGLYSVFTQKIA